MYTTSKMTKGALSDRISFRNKDLDLKNHDTSARVLRIYRIVFLLRMCLYDKIV